MLHQVADARRQRRAQVFHVVRDARDQHPGAAPVVEREREFLQVTVEGRAQVADHPLLDRDHQEGLQVVGQVLEHEDHDQDDADALERHERAGAHDPALPQLRDPRGQRHAAARRDRRRGAAAGAVTAGARRRPAGTARS